LLPIANYPPTDTLTLQQTVPIVKKANDECSTKLPVTSIRKAAKKGSWNSNSAPVS